mgnify:CR=1 FL=1
MNSKVSILVVYTGGTIGMVQDPESGALHPINMDLLYQSIPVLKNFNYKIDTYSFDPLLDSSNMKPDFWIKLARIIEENYELYDGFVVLHGTDTMSYTASVLSFMLENLNKPVILTGSQLPLGVVRTDGRDNIINSIEMAAAKDDETPLIPEVCICFENKLFRGNRTNKYNAENFEAFVSGNYPALAKVGVYIRYKHHLILKPNFKKLKVHYNLDSNVAILKLFPGISENVVKSILSINGLKAVVMETYGSGNAPTEKWFIDSLKSAIDKGIIVFNVTQCKSGSVEIGKYETSVDLGKIGVIGGYDITTESAIAKLMFLLGKNISYDEICKQLQVSIRGELTND